MPWVRLDEQFPDHPKTVIAGPLAGWLHVCALAYCNRMTTDGFIPYNQVGRLADFTTICIANGAVDDPRTVYKPADAYDQAERLVNVGMWEATAGGFRIHDYLDYQPSRAEIEAQRKVKADAGRKGGFRSGQARRNQPGSTTEADASPQSKQPGSTSASRNGAHRQAKQEAKSKPDPETLKPPPQPPRPPSPTAASPAGEEDQLLEATWATMAKHELQATLATGTEIANSGAWLRATRTNLAAEWAGDARRWHQTHPDAGPERLAELILHGDHGAAAAARRTAETDALIANPPDSGQRRHPPADTP